MAPIPERKRILLMILQEGMHQCIVEGTVGPSYAASRPFLSSLTLVGLPPRCLRRSSWHNIAGQTSKGAWRDTPKFQTWHPRCKWRVTIPNLGNQLKTWITRPTIYAMSWWSSSLGRQGLEDFAVSNDKHLSRMQWAPIGVLERNANGSTHIS